MRRFTPWRMASRSPGVWVKMSRMSESVVGSARPCLFCRIVAGDVAAEMVFADEVAVAFLDHSPVFKGHVLIVPRLHVVTLPELPGPLIGPYFERVQRIAAAVPQALDADGTFVAMNNAVSQSVAHLHTHVIPRRFKDGLRGFFWPRLKYADAAERADYADRVRQSLTPRSA